MKRLLICLIACFICAYVNAQDEKRHLFYGAYLQWGYNGEAYTHSNIHFKMSNGDNFILHQK